VSQLFELVVRGPGGSLRHLQVRAADAMAAQASVAGPGDQVIGCAARLGGTSQPRSTSRTSRMNWPRS
jgi:hypothetical protein